MKWVKPWKTSRNWGMLVVGVWLILYGLLQPPIKLSFQHQDPVLGVLAIAAGILLLLGR
jgi:hypothetical protein